MSNFSLRLNRENRPLTPALIHCIRWTFDQTSYQNYMFAVFQLVLHTVNFAYSQVQVTQSSSHFGQSLWPQTIGAVYVQCCVCQIEVSLTESSCLDTVKWFSCFGVQRVFSCCSVTLKPCEELIKANCGSSSPQWWLGQHYCSERLWWMKRHTFFTLYFMHEHAWLQFWCELASLINL